VIKNNASNAHTVSQEEFSKKTCGSLKSITDAVLFLVENTFVTGQIIYVDGGRHLKGHFYDA
jgi:enoyl-[acyl-carrier-protein] reductase (NADH)